AGARDFRNPLGFPPGFSSPDTLLALRAAMGRARRRPQNGAARARARAIARAIRSAVTPAPPPAPPGTLPARPAAQVGGGVRSGWPADPTEAAQLEETLSLLSLKRRKVVYRYLETGNARQSVLDAGYRCKDVRSADDVAREILADPKVQYVLQALLEARGLG